MENTKEKILYASLDLFSKNGYSGTNIREIAEKIGVCKSALYKHFISKEDIFNSLINMTHEYYMKNFNNVLNMKIPLSPFEFKLLINKVLDFTINDNIIRKVRRLLAIEQFRNEDIKMLAHKYYFENITSLFETLFQKMMMKGIIKECNSRMLSYEFSLPISSFISIIDRDFSKLDDVRLEINLYIDYFIEKNWVKE